MPDSGSDIDVPPITVDDGASITVNCEAMRQQFKQMSARPWVYVGDDYAGLRSAQVWCLDPLGNFRPVFSWAPPTGIREVRITVEHYAGGGPGATVWTTQATLDNGPNVLISSEPHVSLEMDGHDEPQISPYRYQLKHPGYTPGDSNFRISEVEVEDCKGLTIVVDLPKDRLKTFVMARPRRSVTPSSTT